VTWLVAVVDNGLYIEKNGAIVQTLLIPASTTYSFDVKLDTSLNALGVVINGTKYL